MPVCGSRIHGGWMMTKQSKKNTLLLQNLNVYSARYQLKDAEKEAIRKPYKTSEKHENVLQFPQY
jgi:hypothetical protein